MSIKWKRRIKDNIYWIFPFIFMALAFQQIRQDRIYHKPVTTGNNKADSSLTISGLHSRIDTLLLNRYRGVALDPRDIYGE